MTDLSENPAITTVTHSKSGATAKVHSLGATVVSFCDQSGVERLFLSKEAVLDGSKPIRGGIPVVFPIFGPPTGKSTMPQHGFARQNHWKLKAPVDDHAEAAVAEFTLDFAKDVTAGCGENNDWNKEQAAKDGTDCKLTLEVRVCPHELITTLTIENTGLDNFNFNALLHTYLKVPDVTKASIHGLGGYAITDKVSGDSGHVQSYDEDITVGPGQEHDAVYIHPEDHPVMHGKVDTSEVIIQLEAAGQVDEAVAPISCVVWNPGQDKAAVMADFGNDEYTTMLCVEPGLLGHQPLLAPNASARLSLTLAVVQKE